MWFEGKFDSAPAELPIEGLGLPPEIPTELPAVPAIDFPAESLATSPAPLALLPADDPGLAASIAGGVTFSEPVQWLLVTAAGLCCAALGRAVVVSTESHSAERSVQQAAAVDPESPRIETASSASLQDVSREAVLPEVATLATERATDTKLTDKSVSSTKLPPTTRPVATLNPAQSTSASQVEQATSPQVQVVRKPIGKSNIEQEVASNTSTCVPINRTRRLGRRR